MTNEEAINVLKAKMDGSVDTSYEWAETVRMAIKALEQPEPCELCSNLEKGDTLYQSSDWDGGIGFDYIWDIRFCPKCGRSLE